MRAKAIFVFNGVFAVLGFLLGMLTDLTFNLLPGFLLFMAMLTLGIAIGERANWREPPVYNLIIGAALGGSMAYSVILYI